MKLSIWKTYNKTACVQNPRCAAGAESKNLKNDVSENTGNKKRCRHYDKEEIPEVAETPLHLIIRIFLIHIFLLKEQETLTSIIPQNTQVNKEYKYTIPSNHLRVQSNAWYIETYVGHQLHT